MRNLKCSEVLPTLKNAVVPRRSDGVPFALKDVVDAEVGLLLQCILGERGAGDQEEEITVLNHRPDAGTDK